MAAERVTELWRRLGFPLELAAAQVVVTPACGLAGATPDYARAALVACVEAGGGRLTRCKGRACRTGRLALLR